MNADLNAARNLSYYLSNPNWSDEFLTSGFKSNENGFNKPLLIERHAKMTYVNRFKKVGALDLEKFKDQLN